MTDHPPPTDSSPTRVLLVDDSEHDRRFFRRIVAESGESIHLTEAANGAEALKRLETEKFDLLVVDLNMPGMDGMELIDRAGELLGDAGVLILSGARDFEAAKKAVRLQVFAYLLKEPSETLKETLIEQMNRAVAHVRLIRENRRLERELRVRVAHLEQVQRLLPSVLLAIVDHDGVILEINDQARGFPGLGEGAPLVGRLIQEMLGRISPALGDRAAEVHRTRGTVQNEYLEARVGEGPDRLLLLNWTRVGEGTSLEQGEGACCIVSLADVTPAAAEMTREVREGFHGILGSDPKIVEMCNLIGRVAPLPTSVLITGPTGSGKEVVARAIHAASDRKSKPFLAVNCTALSREILESELFGHVRGAFTGAVTPRKGRFREADGGTLLLDEIGDTSESFQTKLLRTLETGEIEPVGQDRPVKVDVRIVCATNKNLEELVRQGKFREDLYYRINVVHVRVPPLAGRPGDLPLLVEKFRQEFNRRFGKSIRLVSQEAMRELARHDWPGNVRELRHVMEHAFVVADGPTITRADLPPPFGGSHTSTAAHPAAPPKEVNGAEAERAAAASPAGRPSPGPGGEASEVERIQAALDESGGNIGAAAKRLEMHRTTLWRKMRQFGMEG